LIRFPFSKTVQRYLDERVFRRSLEGWFFTPYRESFLRDVTEYKKFYLPIDIRGKTVLDVGAGEGESAKFFLDNGVKRIIAVEPDRGAFKILQANSLRHPNIIAVNQFFNVGMLWQFKADFVKVDIEGFEECLLDVKPPIPCVVEVHGVPLRERFKAAGWRLELPDNACLRGFSCFGYAYWGCNF
jgi:SAM-dependent methyltransferase